MNLEVDLNLAGRFAVEALLTPEASMFKEVALEAKRDGDRIEVTDIESAAGAQLAANLFNVRLGVEIIEN